jgi:SAM-dependent methyltransferase
VTTEGLPLPPVELAARVGPAGADPARYEEVGRRTREGILAALPEGWSFAGKRVLDFGCGAGRTLRHFLAEADVAELHGCDIDEPSIAWLEANLSPPFTVFVNDERPPLPLESGSFDLIWAISVFTHITDYWADWLVELHRLLGEGGLLIASIHGPGVSDDRAPVPPDPRAARGDPAPVSPYRVGMNVVHYGHPWSEGGPAVFHSAWWIEEHWGRAFEIVSLREEGRAGPRNPRGQGQVVLRRKDVAVTAADFERIDPADERELEALRHNLRQLQHETRELSEARAWLEGERAALLHRLSLDE